MTREEKDKVILYKIQNLAHRLREQLLAEKTVTESKLQDIRTAVSSEEQLRARAVDRMRATIHDELHDVRSSLRREVQAREGGQEDLVQAVSHYTAALQAGMKIVSSQ